MKTLFDLLGAPFARLPFCSLPGAVGGSFAGFIVTLFMLEHPDLTLSPQEQVLLGLMIGMTGWLLILLLYGMILQYGVGAILWPSLLNALLSALLTVFVNLWLARPVVASLLGLLIGILVGALLCRFCRDVTGRQHG